MSAGRCPVCGTAKERRVHLVCPHCWVNVPDAEKEELCRLFEDDRESAEYRDLAFAIVQALLVNARKVQTRAA